MFKRIAFSNWKKNATLQFEHCYLISWCISQTVKSGWCIVSGWVQSFVRMTTIRIPKSLVSIISMVLVIELISDFFCCLDVLVDFGTAETMNEWKSVFSDCIDERNEFLLSLNAFMEDSSHKSHAIDLVGQTDFQLSCRILQDLELLLRICLLQLGGSYALEN